MSGVHYRIDDAGIFGRIRPDKETLRLSVTVVLFSFSLKRTGRQPLFSAAAVVMYCMRVSVVSAVRTTFEGTVGE